MVADKLRSLRLSFAFIENRMTFTTLTTCQILAALLLLPLDFSTSLFVWGLEWERSRHIEEKLEFCLSPCPKCTLVPPTTTTTTTPTPRVLSRFAGLRPGLFAPSWPFLATGPLPCSSGIYFRLEPPQIEEDSMPWRCFYARLSFLDLLFFFLSQRKRKKKWS